MDRTHRRTFLALAASMGGLHAIGLAGAREPRASSGSDRIRHHRRYVLNSRNELVEVEAGPPPRRGSVSAEFDRLQRTQRRLDAQLNAAAERELRAPVSSAGIYPLHVRTFTTSCEGADEDGSAALLTERLGNLRIITRVPFMRRGNMIFCIRSQGLVDPRSGTAGCVDTLFGGGIYWHGRLTRTRFDYELVMFRRGKDTFVGRMSESIDLTRKLGDIDATLYQTEVAYHLDRDGRDAAGRPTLARPLDLYGDRFMQTEVSGCYDAAAQFARTGSADGAAAREACADVPGKRYYQAYDAWLRGFSYDPTTRP